MPPLHHTAHSSGVRTPADAHHQTDGAAEDNEGLGRGVAGAEQDGAGREDERRAGIEHMREISGAQVAEEGVLM